MDIIRSKYWPYIVFAVIFLLSFGILFAFNLVPRPLVLGPSGDDVDHGSLTETEVLPTKISIASVGINTVVLNPSSKIVSTLDEELQKGAVRYPGSGTLGKGNMFIFGHSTGFKTVFNQAYKAFNNLNKVKVGDEIVLESESNTYLYIVKSAREVKDSDTEVIFDTANAGLTLSTCDSFGAKEDRFLVEADFKQVFSRSN